VFRMDHFSIRDDRSIDSSRKNEQRINPVSRNLSKCYRFININNYLALLELQNINF
jgi:hypothetical protein